MLSWMRSDDGKGCCRSSKRSSWSASASTPPSNVAVQTSCCRRDARWTPHIHTDSEPQLLQLRLASLHAVAASSAVPNWPSMFSLANQSRGCVDLVEYLRESLSSFGGSMGDELFGEESNFKFAAIRDGAGELDLTIEEQRLYSDNAR